MTARTLSPYEKNQLRSYGLLEEDLLLQGEMPVEYFTSHVHFAGHDFLLSPDVLIPRVETEELLSILENFLPKDLPKNLLEVGTGSGAIVLSFLAKHKDWQALASDLSQKALKIAEQNAEAILGEKWSECLQFFQADLFKGIPLQEKFSLIVANLPYIPSSRWPELDLSVRDFEPKMALDGGPDGFVLIARLLDQIQQEKRLFPGGKIFLEVDQSHTSDFFEKNYPNLAQHYRVKELPDQYSRQRFLLLTEITS